MVDINYHWRWDMYFVWTLVIISFTCHLDRSRNLSKDNPEIKIISRYLNEGAFGGGTEPNDYEIVLQRPIFNLFNIQTRVDTNSIDKRKWIKYRQ